MGVSCSIDQLCLEPIRNSRLDLQLYLPGLSSTITSYYRDLDSPGSSSKWRGFQGRPRNFRRLCAKAGVFVARRRLSKMKPTGGDHASFNYSPHGFSIGRRAMNGCAFLARPASVDGTVDETGEGRNNYAHFDSGPRPDPFKRNTAARRRPTQPWSASLFGFVHSLLSFDLFFFFVPTLYTPLSLYRIPSPSNY